MTLDLKKWRKARDTVLEAPSLVVLATYEVAESTGRSPRAKVAQAIAQRTAELLDGASDEEKREALEMVAGIEDSKISSVIEGRSSPAQVDDDDGSPRDAEGGGHPSVTVDPCPVRAIGGLVRVHHSDGRIEVVGLGELRRRGR